MKNSKTALMELTHRYSSILRKCALLNATILMVGTLAATSAGATYTYKMADVTPFSEQSSITTQVTSNESGYNLFTGTGIRNIVTGNVNLSIEGESENRIEIPSEGSWDFNKPTGVIGHLYFPKSQKGNWSGSEASETACSAYIGGDLNMELKNTDISGNIYGTYAYLDTSFYNSTLEEQPNLITGVNGKTTITVDHSTISGTIYAAAVPSAGAEPADPADPEDTEGIAKKRAYAEYLKTHVVLNDVLVNINNSTVGEVTPVGAFLTAKDVEINVKGNSQVTGGDGIVAGISRIAGRVTGNTLINLDTDGDNTITITNNVHVGSREHSNFIKESDPNSVLGNATLNILGGGTVNVGGDLRAYHVAGTRTLNISDVTANITGNVAGEFDTINITDNAKLNLKETSSKMTVISGSTLNIEKGSQIVNEGTINFASGSQLKVALNNTEELISGGVVNGSTALIVENGTDNASLVLFDGAQDGFTLTNSLYNVTKDLVDGTYNISKKSTSEVVSTLAKEGVSAQAAQTISAIATSTADLPVLNAISTALQSGNSASAAKAAKDLAPTTSQEVMGVTQGVNGLLSNVAGGRMAAVGKAGGDAFVGGGTWVQGLYNHTKQSKDAHTDGFKANSRGIALGLDGKVNEDVTIGIGYGYTNTDAKAGGHNVSVDANNVFAYAQYSPNQWYINGMVNYGFAKYTEKKAPMGIAMKSKYDVNSYAANLTTGYDFNSGITPEGGLRYLLVDQDTYTDGAQKINADNSDVLTAVLGVKYTANVKTENWTFKPNLRLAATYDVHSDDSKANVSIIGGSSYQITGERLHRFGVEAGAGITGTVKNWDLTLEYNGGFRKDYQSHTGMVKAKYNF